MLLALILMFSVISAVYCGVIELSPGDSVNVDLIAGNELVFSVEEFNEVGYIITDNTYDLVGVLITYDGNYIKLSTAINFKPDNFTITFYDMNNTQTVPPETVYIYRGGGGVRYVYANQTVNQTVIEYVEKDYPKFNYTGPIDINQTWDDEDVETEPIPLWMYIAVVAGFIILVIISRIIYIAFFNPHTFV